MENLIPLLILVVSGIISLFASSRKQKSNKQGSDSFQEDKTPRGDQEIGQSFFPDQEEQEKQPVEEQQESFGEQTVEQKKQQITEKDASPSDSRSQSEEEKPQVEHLSKPRHAKAKKRSGEKTSIQAIKENFDVKEAIIYSEIINRKHF